MRNCRIGQATKSTHTAGPSILPKRNRRCRGQALVEFTLVAMIFFLLSFAVIDFSWLLFNQMNMQDAVREAARYASTGNHIPNPSTPGSNFSRIASITQILENSATGSNIQSIVISSALGGVGSAGAPGDTVTVKAVCDIPLLTTVLSGIFPANQFNFTVSSTFKNEPFPSSQTN
jgi:Flp pilus assembly protein TadG